MSRDLPVIGNPAEPTLHSHCFVTDYSAVDNFVPINWSERSEPRLNRTHALSLHWRRDRRFRTIWNSENL
jgi:hypothetical protein